MYLLGVDSNIMSLAGIAIAIGDVSDMGILMTENIYRRLALEPNRPRRTVIYEAAVEVGRPMLTAVTNTILAFIPVFALMEAEGKLFKPLAYTKTFAITASIVWPSPWSRSSASLPSDRRPMVMPASLFLGSRRGRDGRSRRVLRRPAGVSVRTDGGAGGRPRSGWGS